MVPADTFGPGTFLRWGPMPGSEPVAPTVRGDSGRISIYEGYFVRPPCDEQLAADATAAGDTIVFTIVSRPAAAPDEGCEAEEPAVMGYAALVATLPAGDHVLRVVHEGEARETPVDSVYTVTVAPPRRR